MAIQFDGIDDFLDGGSADVLPEDGTFTIYAAINITSLPAVSMRILQKEAASLNTGGIHFQIDASGAVRLDVQGTTAESVITSNFLSIATDYVLIVTHAADLLATDIHIYINGTEASYATQTNGLVPDDTSTGKLNIGRRGDGSRFFSGIIRELAIFSTVLSAGDIAKLSNTKIRYMPNQVSGLVRYFPMDDGVPETSADGDTIRDLSGNAGNATGDDGANNTGLTWKNETTLFYRAVSFDRKPIRGVLRGVCK